MDESAESRLRSLLLRGLAGDAAAYHAFLRDLATHLRAFLRRRLGRRLDDVEDLVQETLLAVHTQRHTYDAGLPLTAWVHAIARYKLVDFLRRTGSRNAVSETYDDDLVADGHDAHEAADARRDIEKLLAALPDRHRLPILQVKVNGLTVAEAAAATGMSESAVKVGIHRGLKALAARIRGSG